MSGVHYLHGVDAAPDPLLANLAAQQLLGNLLTKLELADFLPVDLTTHHFAQTTHADIFQALKAARLSGRSGQAVVAVSEALRGLVASSVLVDLVSATTTVRGDYTRQLGDVVLDMARRRELRTVGHELAHAAERGDLHEPTLSIAGQAMARIEEVTSGVEEREPLLLGDAMRDAMEAAEAVADGKVVGISTGFPTLDEGMGMLEPGDMMVLAGRPGMGKTALALQIAIAAARGGRPVLMFSFEMNGRALGRRVLASAAGISVKEIKRGRHAEHLGELLKAERELGALPFAIEDVAGQTPSMMAAKCRAWTRRWGKLGLIVVDHLHITRPEVGAERHGGTYAVGQVSNALKRLAKDQEAPLMALAQLNRAVELRDTKRPTNSDLRQSGDIEQDADIIAFIHRPEYYLEKESPERRSNEGAEQHSKRVSEWNDQRDRLRGKAEIILSKSRDGDEIVLPMLFDGPTTSFREPVRSAFDDHGDWRFQHAVEG